MSSSGFSANAQGHEANRAATTRAAGILRIFVKRANRRSIVMHVSCACDGDRQAGTQVRMVYLVAVGENPNLSTRGCDIRFGQAEPRGPTRQHLQARVRGCASPRYEGI